MKGTVILTGTWIPKIKGQFRQRAETFETSARWVTDKGLLDIHRKFAEVSCGDLILDICCGTGIVGENLLCNGARAVGIDISLSMLKYAAKRLHFCINGQSEELAFKDNIFDVAVCRQALHFLDTKKVINEMMRVLKSDGRIVISQIVPFGKEDSDWLYQIHLRKQPLLKNFLNEEDLKDLFINAGCKDITAQEYFIEEKINDWLKDTCFPKDKMESIEKMFIEAPVEYKKLHRTRVVNGRIFDTMRWLILRGHKP